MRYEVNVRVAAFFFFFFSFVAEVQHFKICCAHHHGKPRTDIDCHSLAVLLLEFLPFEIASKYFSNKLRQRE